MNVQRLAAVFQEHAAAYYRKPSGRPTREAENVAAAMAHLVHVAGDDEAEAISPATLRAAREHMIDAGLARTTINARVNRIRRVFKWAVAEQLVAAATLTGLQCLAPLKRGRSRAVEPAGVHPVDEATVDATCQELPDQVGAMVRLQLLTAMRVSELLIMRRCDLDQGETWTYRPPEHKTEHHGHARIIAIGPRARQILEPWLSLEREHPFLFPSMAQDVPIWKNARGKPWTPGNYRQAIVRAAARAGVPHWTPLQLRHTAATRLRRLAGLEAARAVLGHSRASTTEIYAELDQQQAIDAMQLLG